MRNAMMAGSTTILMCSNCRQRLRVPVDRGELILTCPICRFRWDWSPSHLEVRFIDDEESLLGQNVTLRRRDWSMGDLWDDWIDGPRPRERPNEVVLPCPNCRRSLRVPVDRGGLILTCPMCGNRWGWSPSRAQKWRWVQWARRILCRRRACPVIFGASLCTWGLGQFPQF